MLASSTLSLQFWALSSFAMAFFQSRLSKSGTWVKHVSQQFSTVREILTDSFQCLLL
jgi:hypothetical protein